MMTPLINHTKLPKLLLYRCMIKVIKYQLLVKSCNSTKPFLPPLLLPCIEKGKEDLKFEICNYKW